MSEKTGPVRDLVVQLAPTADGVPTPQVLHVLHGKTADPYQNDPATWDKKVNIPSIIPTLERMVANKIIQRKNVIIEINLVKRTVKAVIDFNLENQRTIAGTLDFHFSFKPLAVFLPGVPGSEIKTMSPLVLRKHFLYQGHLFPTRTSHAEFLSKLEKIRVTMDNKLEAEKNEAGKNGRSADYNMVINSGEFENFVTVKCPISAYNKLGVPESKEFVLKIEYSPNDNGVPECWLMSTEAADIFMKECDEIIGSIAPAIEEINKANTEDGYAYTVTTE